MSEVDGEVLDFSLLCRTRLPTTLLYGIVHILPLGEAQMPRSAIPLGGRCANAALPVRTHGHTRLAHFPCLSTLTAIPANLYFVLCLSLKETSVAAGLTSLEFQPRITRKQPDYRKNLLAESDSEPLLYDSGGW